MGLHIGGHCRRTFINENVKKYYFNFGKAYVKSHCNLSNNFSPKLRLSISKFSRNSNDNKNVNKIASVRFSSKILVGGGSVLSYSRNNCEVFKKYGGIYFNSERNFSEQIDISGQGWIYKVLYDSPPIICAQDFFLYAHNISGLPWWATIVLSTVALRSTVTFPLALYQNYIMAKLEIIQIQLKEISKEMGKETSFAVKRFNWSEEQAKAVYIRSMKKQWKKLIEEENCHPAKTALLVLVQVPMWVSLSLALRNLAFMLPIPDIAAQVTALELHGGGVLWFHDLLLPDSSWILPICLGLVNLANIEIQNFSRIKQTGKLQKILTNVFRGVSIVMVPIAATVPSCLSLYWVTSSTVGIIHNLIVLSPNVRQFVGIPPTNSVPKEPYRHIYKQLAARLGFTGPQPPPSAM